MEHQVLMKMEAAIGVMQRYVEQGYSLSCAYSGGKDSTCTLVLMLEAIRRAGGSARQHFVQSADTTIESPTIANFLHAAKCRRHLQFLTNDFQAALNTALTQSSKAIEKGLADKAAPRTEGKGLQHILT